MEKAAGAIKARSHIRCAVLRGALLCIAARCCLRRQLCCALLRCALLCVAFRSTAACFSVMNIHNVEKMADDDEDDVLLLTATY